MPVMKRRAWSAFVIAYPGSMETVARTGCCTALALVAGILSALDGCGHLNQAAPEWDAVLVDQMDDFPAGVSALVATDAGIGVIWNEREDAADLEKIVDKLKKFQHQAKEICR